VAEEHLSFERVMRELQIEEQELKKLVSAGELRAFRDADQMKFKQEDVEKYLTSKGDSDADVIDLLDSDQLDSPASESSGDDLTEELVFDDIDLSDDVGMKTEPLSGDDLFDEEELEESDATMDDELLIGDDSDELIGDEDDADLLRTPVKKSRVGAAAEEEEVESPAFLGVMVFSAIVLVLGILVVMDIATSEPSPMIEWLVNIFKTS